MTTTTSAGNEPIRTLEAAKLLGVSTQILLRWLKQGKIKATRYNAKTLRWDLDEVLRFKAQYASQQQG
jgi:excisionase family DNA binding protein